MGRYCGDIWDGDTVDFFGDIVGVEWRWNGQGTSTKWNRVFGRVMLVS